MARHCFYFVLMSETRGKETRLSLVSLVVRERGKPLFNEN